MGMEGSQEEVGGKACLIFFYLFFSMCFSCTHFLHGSSCQNIVGLQRTAKLQLILEPGTGQEVRRSLASGYIKASQFLRAKQLGPRGGTANTERVPLPHC